jgi:hypothetical protein
LDGGSSPPPPQQQQRPDGRTMQLMGDEVRAVRKNLASDQKNKDSNSSAIVRMRSGPDVQFMSIWSTQTMTSHSRSLRRNKTRKPSFALRVLVQECFAEIILPASYPQESATISPKHTDFERDTRPL